MKTKLHLLFAALYFLGISVYITFQSIQVFFFNKFFEGYAILSQIMVLDIAGLIFALPFLFLKDYPNLLKFILFIIAINVVRFFGLESPLILIPILSLYAFYYFIKLNSKNRNVH